MCGCLFCNKISMQLMLKTNFFGVGSFHGTGVQLQPQQSWTMRKTKIFIGGILVCHSPYRARKKSVRVESASLLHAHDTSLELEPCDQLVPKKLRRLHNYAIHLNRDSTSNSPLQLLRYFGKQKLYFRAFFFRSEALPVKFFVRLLLMLRRTRF